MLSLFKRLLILGGLSCCLAVLGLSEKIEPVFAGVCYQVCDAERAMCDDNCMSSCSDTDEACNQCIYQCSSRYNRCMQTAIWCDNGGYSYSPICVVEFGQHCPLVGGIADCLDPNTHNGYYQTCNAGPGGAPCVSCPQPHLYGCPGAGSMPACL